MDIVSPKTRSRMMSGIQAKDTKPELIVRKALHKEGFRYRLHAKDLPGKPDIVLPKYKAVILINGCFWHGHDCHLFKWPSTRQEFWLKKITGNQQRDIKNRLSLEKEDWKSLVVWECAIRGKHRLPLEPLISLIKNWLLVGDCSVDVTGISAKHTDP